MKIKQRIFQGFDYLKVLTRRKNKLKDENEINFIFSNKYIHPLQIKEEFIELLSIIKKTKPKYIVEIGTSKGGGLFLFSRFASENANIVSIDFPSDSVSRRFMGLKSCLIKSIPLKNQKLHLIRKNSHDKKTIEKVKNILKNNKLDFLFIDGDHSYEGAKKDFEMYSPLVKKNGIIAFHDIVAHPSETGCEVNKFWEEIKKKYPHQEIIDKPNQDWGGIGIIIKD